jgi:phage/plasmid-like protein (TIGR03299 family)
MAHELTNANDMIYSGETPWHKLGIKLPARISLDEIENYPTVAYRVEKRPLYDGDLNEVPWNELVRTDTGAKLGFCSPQYTPIQNLAAARAVLGNWTASGEANVETCLSLQGGRRWALCASLPGDLILRTPDGKDDVLNRWVVVSNSFDGSSMIRVSCPTVRVVCANTLAAAEYERNNRLVAIRHTAGAEAQLKDALVQMGAIQKQFEGFQAAAEALMRVQVSAPELRAYAAELYPSEAPTAAALTGDPIEDARARLIHQAALETWAGGKGELSEAARGVIGAFETQPGRDLAAGSWWQAVNAVTYYEDHLARRLNEESRANQSLLGDSARHKRKAMKEALVLVNKR